MKNKMVFLAVALLLSSNLMYAPRAGSMKAADNGQEGGGASAAPKPTKNEQKEAQALEKMSTLFDGSAGNRAVSLLSRKAKAGEVSVQMLCDDRQNEQYKNLALGAVVGGAAVWGWYRYGASPKSGW